MCTQDNLNGGGGGFLQKKFEKCPTRIELSQTNSERWVSSAPSGTNQDVYIGKGQIISCHVLRRYGLHFEDQQRMSPSLPLKCPLQAQFNRLCTGW